MTIRVALLLPVLAVPAFAPQEAPAPRYERVHALRSDEGIFAYARVTPDGRYMAYASQERDTRDFSPVRIINVVDLRRHEVVYTEPGIDPYWSNDGTRMIYTGVVDGAPNVTIRHHPHGDITRNAAPATLGDYYSWATRDGRDVILTILGNYFVLDGDRGQMPHSRVLACPGIGVGSRPLVSHDGTRISAFVRGTVVVRNLEDCADIIDTGIAGGKADFSWDGRYLAMHVLKPDGRGYQIVVVDLRERTVRTVTNLPGSSLFPSWLADGRLFFNYDGDEYRGFMIASDFMRATVEPLPTPAPAPSRIAWNDVFPAAAPLADGLGLVMIWSTWSAHSPEALQWLQEARDNLAHRSVDVDVMTATEPATRRRDATAMLSKYAISLPHIPLDVHAFMRSKAANQMPTTLLFRDGVLVDVRLGAQTAAELGEWVLTQNAISSPSVRGQSR